MKKSINFKGLNKISLIIAAVLVVVGIVLHLIFGSYSLGKFGVGFYLKALVAAVLVLGLTMIYFLIRFKKPGVKMALCSALGATVSAVTAFALTVICRANFGDITFALMLFAVVLSYITFVIFAYSFSVKPANRRKKDEPSVDAYSVAADKTFKTMRPVAVIILALIIATLIISAIFGAKIILLYVLPAILTAVFSVVFTIAVSCRLFADKA